MSDTTSKDAGPKDSGNRDLGYQFGLLSFIRPTTVLRLAHRLPTTSPRRIPRTLGITAAGLVGLPLQAYEFVRHGRRRAQQELAEPPVFIVGHWRSGTTHLHNLMSQDPQFGSLRMFQALAPDFSVSANGWLPRMFERLVPTKRPMDNMEWPMDAPQEEEIPLAKVTPYSWYLQFLFPRDAVRTFRQAVLFDGAPRRARAEVKRKYDQIVRTAALHSGGRRILSKNPVNTARIPVLLELYPDARFVFIHRSPNEVFPSTVNLHEKILSLTALQSVDRGGIEENVVEMYGLVMRQYLIDRDVVAPDRLTEVAYADLDAHPEATVASIYEALDLDGHAEAAPHIAAYVASQQSYRKNRFAPLSDRVVELIERRWGFAFDEWGYERQSVEAGVATTTVAA